MSTVHVGLVGCGVMGAHYARVLSACETAVLHAVCDLDPSRLEPFADQWSIPTHFPDHAAMLAAGGLDAVVVATPDFAHCAPVCDSLAAGCAVLCEKPLATTIADADQIVEAAAAAGVPFMVNFGNRHRSNVRRIRQALQDEELGRVQHVDVRLNERIGKTFTLPWLEQTSPVWFLLSHCVDLVTWLLGENLAVVHARSALGRVAQHAPGVPDLVTCLAWTESGTGVFLESSWALPDNYPGDIDFALQVLGTRGMLQADLLPHDLHITTPEGSMARDYSMDVTLPGGRVLGWWEESVRTFVRGVATGERLEPDAAQGREVTRALIAMDRSLETGAPAAVSEV